MLDENVNISLNVAALPYQRKKKNQINAVQKQIQKQEFEPFPTVQPSTQTKSHVPFKGILKESKTGHSTSIWKAFKQANKGNKVHSAIDNEKPVEEKKKVTSEKNVTWNSANLTSTSEVDDEESYEILSDHVKKKKKKTFISDDFDGDSEMTNFHLKRKDNIPGKQTSLFGNNPEIPQVPHRAVKPLKEPVFSNLCFSDMALHPYMVKYLNESMGLTKMTTVQQKSIPVLLEKKDALIRSQTGSGKTLAFALPILHHLQEVRPKINRIDGVMVLVVVPTRELALQTYEVFNKLVKSYTWIVPGYLVGGEKRKSEKARLRKGISVLIGTPGRLVDHLQNTKCLNLEKVSCLVLDEADRLFDMGYEKDVSNIIASLDKGKTNMLKPDYINPGESKPIEPRHTILLSATLTPKVMQLAGLSLTDPVFVDACDDSKTTVGSVPIFSTDEDDNSEVVALPQSLLQQYIVVPAKLRLVTLSALILWKCKLTPGKKILVFIATQDMVDYHAELLSTALSEDSEGEGDSPFGIEFFKLHGSMNQKERTEVFNTFRKADSGVLFCTDVAARGLDLPEVDWVVQYTGPTSVPDYVHRVGRTARGGQSGSSILFLLPSEVSFIALLEDRRIRLGEEKLQNCLQKLWSFYPESTSCEEAASGLQTTFERIVAEQTKMRNLASRAYSSWSRFYSSYPRSMKPSFNIKSIHQGHYAKSFALRDSPTAVISRVRGMVIKDKTWPKDRARERRPRGPAPKKRMTVVSEYDSGLEPLPKKAK